LSRLPSKLALARLGSIRCLATLQLLMCRLKQLLFCIACIHLEPFVLICLRRGKYIIYTSLHALSNHLALILLFSVLFFRRQTPVYQVAFEFSLIRYSLAQVQPTEMPFASPSG